VRATPISNSSVSLIPRVILDACHTLSICKPHCIRKEKSNETAVGAKVVNCVGDVRVVTREHNSGYFWNASNFTSVLLTVPVQMLILGKTSNLVTSLAKTLSVTAR
jgi:hypothetical protein